MLFIFTMNNNTPTIFSSLSLSLFLSLSFNFPFYLYLSISLSLTFCVAMRALIMTSLASTSSFFCSSPCTFTSPPSAYKPCTPARCTAFAITWEGEREREYKKGREEESERKIKREREMVGKGAHIK